VNLVERLIEMDRRAPKRILVIGDGMTDVYVHGRLEDQCQEGCPKFVEESRISVPGGAANAARSLDHWCARTQFRGTPHGPTKTRFMVDDRCVFRFDDDRGRTISNFQRIRAEAIQDLRTGRRHFDAVYLSDYDKGMLTPEFICEVGGICWGRAIPCVADAKRSPEVYDGTILKCNFDWFSRNKRMGYLDPNLVITYGPSVPSAGGELVKFDGQPVKCVNHVGAGDCFGAHLTLALACGFSLKDAAAIAHSAGRVYVQFSHNRPPQSPEIAADFAAAST
jgi:bifunctional ADP-heptose synthase (sugar kinase/adenylyltransferase)